MGNVPMSNPEMALAVHKERFSTNNTFIQMEDGRIFRVAGGWQMMSSEDGGLSWSKPHECIDPEGTKVGGSGICLVNLNSKNGVGLVAIRPGNSNYEPESVFWRSQDGGKTWSAPVVCSVAKYSAHSFPNSMLRLESGRLMLAVYTCLGQGGTRASHLPFAAGYVNGQYVTTDAHYMDPHFAAAYVLYSDDEGQTWKKSVGELFVHVDEFCASTAEPSVVEVTPNKLLMFVRTQLGRIYQAWSEDGGQNWTRLQPTALASSASPARLAKMPDTGHLLCVWNQHSEEEIRKGYIRSRLSAATSRNGGGVWEFFQNVHSIHEQRWVPPGPIRKTRPEYRLPMAGQAAEEWDTRYVEELPTGYGRWSNCTVLVCKDRVLINCSNHASDEQGNMPKEKGHNLLKVLPLEWFYRGLDRKSENPVLQKVSKLPPGP